VVSNAPEKKENSYLEKKLTDNHVQAYWAILWPHSFFSGARCIFKSSSRTSTSKSSSCLIPSKCFRWNRQTDV